MIRTQGFHSSTLLQDLKVWGEVPSQGLPRLRYCNTRAELLWAITGLNLYPRLQNAPVGSDSYDLPALRTAKRVP
jgi:hypothetical protein